MTNNYRWYQNYFRLLAYYELHGNIDIKQSYVTKDGLKLGAWLVRQKLAYRKGNLSEERIRQLEHLHIKWNTQQDNWDEMYAVLKAYYDKNGHSNIPTRYAGTGNRKIGPWINNQRKAYYGLSNSILTKDRIAKLNMIEFDWSLWHTALLNREITTSQELAYQRVMLDRMKHILEDLSYEIDGNITSLEKQEAINKEIIKRMWK